MVSYSINHNFLNFLSARTPLVVSFIILIIFIYHRLKVYKVALALTTFSLLITSVLALVFTNNRFKELFNENGILQEDRVQTWRGAYEVASDHFWFGIPKGDLDDELEKVYKKNNHTKGLRDHTIAITNTYNYCVISEYLDYIFHIMDVLRLQSNNSYPPYISITCI